MKMAVMRNATTVNAKGNAPITLSNCKDAPVRVKKGKKM